MEDLTTGVLRNICSRVIPGPNDKFADGSSVLEFRNECAAELTKREKKSLKKILRTGKKKKRYK